MSARPSGSARSLPKAQTGVIGLDEITGGGLPRGRPTLVCGGPGCGKTVLAMQFLAHGADALGEPGLFVSFEESPKDLAQNFGSFGVDLDDLVRKQRLRISHVELARDEVLEAGEFSLDALLIRLQHGIAQVGAKRLVLDTPETLFSYLSDSDALRQQIARLFRWLRDSGVTSVVTAEKGARQLSRHGLEEYLSDCVLLLDHRVRGNIAKRRLRIVKYRGSAHGLDEYPFLIGASGVAVFPITSVELSDRVSTERVSTGVRDLDAMLEGRGYFRGSTVLVSGTAGTGKSTLAAAFASAACREAGSCLYFAFEESLSQITRNMRSVGIDLAPHIEAGTLHVQALRPTLHGLEEHLVEILEMVERVKPAAVVMDPVTNFVGVGSANEVKSMLTRILDRLKANHVTALLTSLTPSSTTPDEANARVSSLVDTWITLNYDFKGRQGRRWLHVAKSRGMGHSQEARQMFLSSDGVLLRSAPETDEHAGATLAEAKDGA